ncbi:response regulator [Deferribacter thermophilus]|uniref:hybrid sensor histidine kinase/response regulator n=1 Tax=Deferribacter thermophilus TaxID=53573 RepID=UPI003C1BA392
MAKIDKKELVQFFLLESEEHFETIFNGINVLLNDLSNWSIIEEIYRSTHTLKGSSAMVDFKNFSAVAHRVEDIFDDLKTGRLERNRDLILKILEVFHELNDYLQKNKNDLTEDLKNHYLELLDIKENVESIDSQEKALSGSAPEHLSTVKNLDKIHDIVDQEFPVKEPESNKSFVRVDLEKIDFLLNLTGELVVTRNKQNENIREIISISKELEYSRDRLVKVLDEFREKYMYNTSNVESDKSEEGFQLLSDFFDGEFDKYTDINILSRQLVEIGTDITSLIALLSQKFLQIQNDINYINRVTNSLEKSLTNIKLVPVKNLFNTAMRTATVTARQEGKDINITVSGENLEIDKAILDLLTDSFLHLVRNAVSHGIENKQERLKKGKSNIGNIKLSAYRAGNSILFDIEDDGSGIDIEKIKMTIVEKGLLTEYEASQLRTDELISYIFQPGFSTASQISDVSGRGVGLDVVKKNVESLGGTITVSTKKDKYTKFTIMIPVTQFIADYLLIGCEGRKFAIPLQSIYEIIPVDIKNIKKIGDHFFYNIRKDVYEIIDLAVALGLKNRNEFKNDSYGILVSGPNKKYIIQVDDIFGRETTVTKKFKSFIARIDKYLGASISSGGEVRPIIDTLRLFSSKLKTRDFIKVDNLEKGKSATYYSNGVLIVDDSISVRKYLKDILVGNGYKVLEAKDGLQALEVLEHHRVPYIITDLEMPNLNGYELIDKIRNNLEDESVKIYVITSRGTEKHKTKALELGVNGFIVKPFTEEMILGILKGIEHESTDV